MNAPAPSLEPEVHPSAALFPMLPPDELQELADSIAANGLQQPIVMQGDVLIDGRNRLKACRLAGVEPTMVQLTGDADAFILGANINRRHMTKGQRAMAVATIYPDPARMKRRGSGSSGSEHLHAGVLSNARAILRWAPELASAVLAGAESLDRAYAIAAERKTAAEVPERRLNALQASDPDLASKVREGDLALDDAAAAASGRRESERTRRQGLYDCLDNIERLMFMFRGDANLAALIEATTHAGELKRAALVSSLDEWIKALTNAKEALK